MTRSLALLLVLSICACSDDDGPSLRDDVSGVTTIDGAGRVRFVSGATPPTQGPGPELEVATNAVVIPGGSTPVTLSSTTPFSVVVVAIDGVGGYYEIQLPSPVLTVQLLVTLAQELAALDFAWVFGVGADRTPFGYTTTPVTVVPVGTGDVQVSLSWMTEADVDLHVVDPANEEIYYGHRTSTSGGELDLDSNAGCGSDNVRNENITWPVGGAPAGSYRVLVDYWSSCGVASTPFVVTVRVRDREPLTFTGTLTGTGDSGGAGAGQLIATFE
jgi:hypothetical protein